MILLIDNYDSFTHNLVQVIGSIDPDREIRVVRNDKITPDEVDAMEPTHLIISPGPCTPDQSGAGVEIILRLAGRVPILGVCLGHQCIAQAFGARIVPADRLMHGKTSRVQHDGRTVFAGLSNPFTATRYHSLSVQPDSLPVDFEVSAWAEGGREIMGIRHCELPIEGVQFHPESFLTIQGPRLMANYLAM